MKGLSTTLVIVVTAIVILVAALVILAIFGQAIWPIADITTARNICLQQAAVTCQASNQMPPGWNTVTYQYIKDNQRVSATCYALTGCNACSCINPAA